MPVIELPLICTLVCNYHKKSKHFKRKSNYNSNI